MNTLFILGNGFDRNLNLNTSYLHFYKEYIKKPSPIQEIATIKKLIKGDVKYWSDMEEALGRNTIEFDSPEKLIEVHDDISDNLAEFLEVQEKKLDLDNINISRFKNHLTYPDSGLNNIERNKTKNFWNRRSNRHWNVNIMTFNYTNTLESILGSSNRVELLKRNTFPTTLGNIFHVHGTLENGMVMGVNDKSQIANNKIHSHQFALEHMVKSTCNEAIGSGVDIACKGLITSSDIICVFGSSIGITDKIWWQLIAKELLKRDCLLIIYDKGEDIIGRKNFKLAEPKRKVKEKFLNQTNLSQIEKDKVFDKIFVGINAPMFNILKNTPKPTKE